MEITEIKEKNPTTWKDKIKLLLYSGKNMTVKQIQTITGQKNKNHLIKALTQLEKEKIIKRKKYFTTCGVYLYRLSPKGMKQINPDYSGRADAYQFFTVQHNTEVINLLVKFNKILNETDEIKPSQYFSTGEARTILTEILDELKDKKINRRIPDAIIHMESNDKDIFIEYERSRKKVKFIQNIIKNYVNYFKNGICSGAIFVVNKEIRNSFTNQLERIQQTTDLIKTVFFSYDEQTKEIERLNLSCFKGEKTSINNALDIFKDI